MIPSVPLLSVDAPTSAPGVDTVKPLSFMVVTDAPWVVEPAGVVTPVPIVASGVLAPDPFVLANAVAEKNV